MVVENGRENVCGWRRSFFRQRGFFLAFVSIYFDPCSMNVTLLFSIFVVKSKISSSEYIIRRKRMKGRCITFAEWNCLDGKRFGYLFKLAGLLLKTTKRLFQLFLKSVKTVESKGQRRLNSFKKQILVFSNTGDFVFKVSSLLMITKHLKLLFIPLKNFSRLS